MERKAYLILANGKVFEAKRFGADGETIGELVFSTAMTGYLETLTDPAYYGQIVMQTFPLVGNYGVISSDLESRKPSLKAYIVHDWCQTPSNFRCEGDIDTFLKSHGVIGLYGLDVREITRILREFGVMNAVISDTPELTAERRRQLHGYSVQDAVAAVSGVAGIADTDEGELHTVVWDFGARRVIARSLQERGCRVSVVAHDATAQQIADLKPDGVVLSDGPGDPSDNFEIIEQIRLLTEKNIPIFGLGLGHQMLALARGAMTHKLKYGHRGSNQPVIDTDTGRIHITSQNHGYAVTTSTLPAAAQAYLVNANDASCEGIRYTDIPAISAQFGAEACGFMFDAFVKMMKEEKDHAAE